MTALLRSLWREPRPGGAPRRLRRDWVLVAVLTPAVLVEGVLRPGLDWRVVSVAVTVALVPTLLWRRTRPLAMVLVAFGVLAVLAVPTAGRVPQLYSTAFVLLLPYALARWGSGREVALGAAAILAKAALTFGLARSGTADVLGGFAVLTAVTALGAALRYRSRARGRELDQAKLLERERLARDLHDTVAHHVSAIAIRAQAGLALAPLQPEAATDALRVIEAEASRTLAEMRSMVRVLRRPEPAGPAGPAGPAEPAELAPTPQLADLEQLAGRPQAGPAVEVEITGDVAGLPPSVGAAIYRLAQESVTNARRHARRATTIEVLVDADETSVRLRVRDDGEPSAAADTSTGFGLVGMVERARLLGGSCEAGPGPGRGWTVSAVLPRTGTAT